MFWFAYFSVVFCIHEIYIRRSKQLGFEAHGMSFPCTELLLFNYVSVFWTLCSLFFPCPSWVSLFGYFPVLVKLIWLLLAPVLVLLDYVLCVYKSWVLPESLSIYVVFPVLFIDLLKRREVWLTSSLLCPFRYTTRVRWTDPLTEGWLRLRTNCGVCGRPVGGWNGMWRISSSLLIWSFFIPLPLEGAESLQLTPRREPPHAAPTAACPTPNTPFSSEASPASSAPSRHSRRSQGCRSRLTQACRSQGNPGRRPQLTQARCPRGNTGRHSWPTQACHRPRLIQGQCKPAAVHGSLTPAGSSCGKPAGLSTVKPAAGSTCAPRITGGLWGYVLKPSSRARSSTASSSARTSRAPSRARSSRMPPRHHSFPQENVWGGHMPVAKTAKATENLLWPPESPDPPWPPVMHRPGESPVSPSWTSLQGTHPPPRQICYGVRRVYREARW